MKKQIMKKKIRALYFKPQWKICVLSSNNQEAEKKYVKQLYKNLVKHNSGLESPRKELGVDLGGIM